MQDRVAAWLVDIPHSSAKGKLFTKTFDVFRLWTCDPVIVSLKMVQGVYNLVVGNSHDNKAACDIWYI
jgi:hypothetical protein